jgi:hypothetical protein
MSLKYCFFSDSRSYALVKYHKIKIMLTCQKDIQKIGVRLD